MASSNLDVVRSIYEGWGQGDFSSSEWADAEIELSFAGGPEPGSWRGLDAMARAYGEWLRAWDDFRAEPEHYIAIDSDRILVLVRNSGRGKVSGLELDEHAVANYFQFRDGKVTRVVVYLDRELAFADLGIAEEDFTGS